MHLSTFQAWEQLIKLANSTLEIGSFYWTLRGVDFYNHSSAWEGEKIFDLLMEAGTKRKLNITIAQSKASSVSPNLDTIEFEKYQAASVRSVDFRRLLGGGVLHTKLWIADRKHFYVGSANNDWRSLTQVKELGLLILNCPCLSDDIAKIFDVYWRLGEQDSKIPAKWPKELSTSINQTNPIKITFTNVTEASNVYIASSPAPLSPTGRTNDIDAILNVILNADKFVYISVMDYVPLTLFTKKKKFWPIIDDALRQVAIEKKVHVKLLISQWAHSRPEIVNFLKSLSDLTDTYHGVEIEVRRFIVPATPDQEKIPFGRVNHNKYMVTDKTAYIGTSNWSGDYFIDTAGIGFVIEDSDLTNQKSIRSQLESIFERDWYSPYAVNGYSL